MNSSDERQLDAEADAYQAEADEARRAKDRLSRLRWVVVSIEGGREVAAFNNRTAATAWMDHIGHVAARLRLEERA